MPDSFTYKSDCRFFRGDIPCAPHKREGVHCIDCSYYEATDRNILIIKLGAIGDVIRTTPLLHKLRAIHPHARIWWMALTPEVLPASVDVKMKFTMASVMSVLAVNFDLLINLDKDREACALADRIEASVKKGFIIRNGVISPVDKDARHKFLTGIFDDANKANTKHYVQEIFEVCGYEWNGEEYILDVESCDFGLDHSKPIIGLNTGCGGRWTSRLWPDTHWIELAHQLCAMGYLPLFLGGQQEHDKNQMYQQQTNGLYLGFFDLPKFMALMNECDVIVSAVTMAMHFAIGLKKPLVLFNNIFNRHEFELYGRGEILEPSKPCTCFFRPTCINDEYKCMNHLEPERVAEAVKRSIAIQ